MKLSSTINYQRPTNYSGQFQCFLCQCWTQLSSKNTQTLPTIHCILKKIAYLNQYRSIKDGIVPDDLKIAKIVPIFKSDDKRTVSNYRPISILPVFSKILERLIYNRLLDFINKFDILSNGQYGFRKNISTSLALIHLMDRINT